MIKWTTLTLFLGVVGLSGFVFGADDPAGKTMFLKEKCNTCHTVQSQGIEATRGEDKAPDMSNAGASIPSAEWAKKFVLREEAKDGKKHRRPFKGSEKDLEAIVEWLMSLKAS